MNCPEARDRLAGLLYGDLQPGEASTVRAHLAACPACRHEHAALEGVRRALDSLPAPAVQVDLPRLYREAAARQVRRAGRWRWTAVACGAAATMSLLVLGLRLEVRVESHQLVVRWGAAPAPDGLPLPAPAPRVERPEPPSPAVEERLRVLSEIIHALADDVAARDQQEEQRVDQLRARLDELQRQGNRRWSEMDRSVAALYAAHFLAKKGEKP